MRGLAAGVVAMGLALIAGVGHAAAADGCANASLRVGDSVNLPDCRAYELVTPAYKPAGIGVGYVYQGFGDLAPTGFPALEGDRFAAMGQYGSTLVDDGVAFVSNFGFAARTTAGWTSHSPLTHALQTRQVVRFPQVLSMSDDLSRFTLSSNLGGLRIFPELVGDGFGVPTFVGSWEGRWELFGPTDPAQRLNGNDLDVVLSANGSVALGWGRVWGLAGTDAPDHPAWPDRPPPAGRGRSVYVADVSGQLADSFGNTGGRELVNVCTGAGAARTVIPQRRPDGKLDGQPCPEALAGRSARLVSHHGAFTALTAPQTPAEDPLKNIVSADGRRVFFMAPDPAVAASSNPGALQCAASTGPDSSCPSQLFVRQTDADGSNPVVRWISRPEGALLGQQDASLLGPTYFEGATPEGDKVFFRSPSPLTADDPNGGVPLEGGVTTGTFSTSSWDLFMYDMPDGPGSDPGDGELTRISAGPDGTGDCNNPQPALSPFGLVTGRSGSLRFASDDGSRLYFVCAAPLPGVAGASNGTTTTPDGTVESTDFTNLYLYDANRPLASRYRFVARLPRATNTTGGLARCASTGQYDAQPLAAIASVSRIGDHNANCVRGTGDGSFITFFTDGGLVAGDDAGSGDVYGYDALSDDLVRLSTPPAGVGSYECVTGPFPQPAGAQCFGDGGFNHSEQRQPQSWLGVATAPDVFGGGHVAFFQSRSRLLPGDLNDVYDVYRWRDGELSLVSTGAADADHALYKGNDRTGRNVYIATRDSLSWQDSDAVADIYVARVDGGSAEPPPPPVCAVLTDACRPVGRAGIEGAGSSAPGGGNARSRPVLVSLRKLSRVQRRRAARTGVLRVRVRTSAPGIVRVGARARIGRRLVKVAGARKRLAKAGATTVRLRLDRRARRVLRSGRTLRITLRVAQAGARTRAATVRLDRGAKS
jgi:hypothetical protein